MFYFEEEKMDSVFSFRVGGSYDNGDGGDDGDEYVLNPFLVYLRVHYN